MKNEFIGYYKPTKEEKDSAWNDGVFIFDSSALLNLYRYSTATSKDFLDVLKKLKDRLFLPYQVAYEFHKNRYAVIEDSIGKYEVLANSIHSLFEKNIQNQFNQVKRHPSINIDPLNKLADQFLKDIGKELEMQKNAHPDFFDNDSIITQLSDIFDAKVGIKPDDKRLKEIALEGKERYEKQIPPGYKDNQKTGSDSFGDLIIWKQIIEWTKKEKKPVIFVTDDQKEDWWIIRKDQAVMPRAELIKEFYDQTGVRILIYTADRFLRGAKKRGFVKHINSSSLSEIGNISKYFNTLKNSEEVNSFDENYSLLMKKLAKSSSTDDMKNIVYNDRFLNLAKSINKFTEFDKNYSSLLKAINKSGLSENEMNRIFKRVEFNLYNDDYLDYSDKFKSIFEKSKEDQDDENDDNLVEA